MKHHSFSNKNQKKLAENVYTESAPMMCEIDGKKILVMLTEQSILVVWHIASMGYYS